MQISFSVRIILKEALSLRSYVNDLCLISKGWATALLQLHNINPYNTGLLWQLMSLNSLYSKDVYQNNAVHAFAPVTTGSKAMQKQNSALTGKPHRALQLSAICLSYATVVLRLFSPSRGIQIGVWLRQYWAQQRPPKPPEKHGELVHIQFHLSVLKDEVTNRWDNQNTLLTLKMGCPPL